MEREEVDRIAQDSADYLWEVHGAAIRRYEAAGKLGKFFIKLTNRAAMIVMPVLQEYEKNKTSGAGDA